MLQITKTISHLRSNILNIPNIITYEVRGRKILQSKPKLLKHLINIINKIMNNFYKFNLNKCLNIPI